MLIKKCVRVLKNNGVGALTAKALNRMKYAARGREFAEAFLPSEEELQRQRTTVFNQKVVISIVVPLYNTSEVFLRQMIESVLSQTYRDWELCLADGGSRSCERIVKSYKDSRIKYYRLDKNYGIAINTNFGAIMATGEYIGLLDHDDLLAPNALFEVRKRIDKGADFIYTDELSFRENPLKPDIIHFKPDFSPFNLRGNNYICHFSVFKNELFMEERGVREGFEGSQDHDLFLRLTEKAEKVAHVGKVLYMWRIHGGSVSDDISAKPYCIYSGVLAISGQLLRKGIPGEVEDIGGGAAVYRCRYRVKDSVSCRVIKRCSLKALRECKTDYIALVPRGLKVSREQIKRLISIAALENVGAVGGIGVYKGRVTSGAVRFDGEGGMETVFLGERVRSGGYMHRLNYAQNVNALNCFGVFSRAAFDAVGGFDGELSENERFADLCLKMRDKGYNIVLDPEVRAEDKYVQGEMSTAFESKHEKRLKTEDEYVTNAIADYTM